MPISIEPEWVGGLLLTGGLVLGSIAGDSHDPTPPNCVDPDMVMEPDTSVDAPIAVHEPVGTVDTAMVQSPGSECKPRSGRSSPEQN